MEAERADGVEGIKTGASSCPGVERPVVREKVRLGLWTRGSGQTGPVLGQQHPLAALADTAVYHRLGLHAWGGAARV